MTTKSEKGTILVPIDGSHNSLIAVGVAARMAGLLDAHLGLIHVLDVPPLAFWGGIETRMKDDIRNQAEERLADIAARINQSCGVLPEFYIVEGAPEEEIKRAVDEDPLVMMVVIGSHGMATEKKSQLRLRRDAGRMGARLTETLHVPVVLVPPDVNPSQICSAMQDIVGEAEAGLGKHS